VKKMQISRLDTSETPLVTQRTRVEDFREVLKIDAGGKNYNLALDDFIPLAELKTQVHPATWSEINSLLKLSTLSRRVHRDGTTLLVLALGETGPEQNEIVLDAAFRLPSATAVEPARKAKAWLLTLLAGVLA